MCIWLLSWKLCIALAVPLFLNGTPNVGSSHPPEHALRERTWITAKKGAHATLAHLFCIWQPIQVNRLTYSMLL